MRKRGKPIRHRAASLPGVVAQAIDPQYETQLRNAVASFQFGYAAAAQFNDLCDTHDLLMIANGMFGRYDESVNVALQATLIALQNIRDRFHDTKKLGATGEEIKALNLLAETSLDFWNRRSGALFYTAYNELKQLRIKQREELHERTTTAAN